MDKLGQIEFTGALSRLQGLIGTEIKATVNFYGQFFDFGMQGELNRVETLPPDYEAIAWVLDEQTGFYLDPADTETYVGRGAEGVVELAETADDFVSPRSLFSSTGRPTPQP